MPRSSKVAPAELTIVSWPPDPGAEPEEAIDETGKKNIMQKQQ